MSFDSSLSPDGSGGSPRARHARLAAARDCPAASRHAAPFFGSSRIGFQDDDLQLLLYVDFQGERSFNDLAVSEQGKDEIYAKDENGNNYAPGWATLNLKAFYELNDQFSVSAGLENITDVRYRPYSSGISGAGRNFFISLRTNI